jgi:protein-S-isoprenylcysteine O-methyltransferase Ste14
MRREQHAICKTLRSLTASAAYHRKLEREIDVIVERSTLAHIGVSLVGPILLIWFGLRRPLNGWQEFGLGLAVASFILWATARWQLGRSFSVKPRAKALVTRGIYSRIRNPIYTFGTLWITGVILLVGHPEWLVVLLALIPMQFIRAGREARVLEEKFGEEYRTYRRRTWF